MTTVTITLDNGLEHTFKSPDAAIWSNDGRSYMRVHNLHMGMCTWLEDRDDPNNWGFVVGIRHGLPPGAMVEMYSPWDTLARVRMNWEELERDWLRDIVGASPIAVELERRGMVACPRLGVVFELVRGEKS